MKVKKVEILDGGFISVVQRLTFEDGSTKIIKVEPDEQKHDVTTQEGAEMLRFSQEARLHDREIHFYGPVCSIMVKCGMSLDFCPGATVEDDRRLVMNDLSSEKAAPLKFPVSIDLCRSVVQTVAKFQTFCFQSIDLTRDEVTAALLRPIFTPHSWSNDWLASLVLKNCVSLQQQIQLPQDQYDQLVSLVKADSTSNSCTGGSPQARTLVHGDLWPGNVMANSEKTFIIDWQFCYASANPMLDVALFIFTALTTADRRKHEQSLLQSYVEQLGVAAKFWKRSETRWLEGNEGNVPNNIALFSFDKALECYKAALPTALSILIASFDVMMPDNYLHLKEAIIDVLSSV